MLTEVKDIFESDLFAETVARKILSAKLDDHREYDFEGEDDGDDN